MNAAVHRYDCDPGADLGTPVPQAQRRPLALIAADAIKANCGHCWARPGEPCDAEGMHLARFARARRHRAISGPDMAAVLDIAAPDPEDVFTPATVIAAERAGATSWLPSPAVWPHAWSWELPGSPWQSWECSRWSPTGSRGTRFWAV